MMPTNWLGMRRREFQSIALLSPIFNLLLTHGAVSAGVLRGQPASARIPPVHFGFRTGSPRPLRGRGRGQDAGGRPPRRWNGWSPAGPPTAPTPGPRSERPPVPVRSTPSPATPAGTPSSAPASSTPSAPFRGHERPRQDHGPGNSGLPQGGDLHPRLPRIFRTGGRARRAAPGCPQVQWRCSSRERGDWPGPAGRACTGGRRQERGEALQHGRGRRRKPVPGAKGGGGRARHRYRMRPRAETGIIGPTASRQSDRTAAGDRAAPGGTRAGPSRRPRTARTRFSGRRSAPGTGTAGADMGRNRSPRSPQLRIPQVNSRMVSRAGKKRFSVSKIMVTIRLFRHRDFQAS